MLFYLAKNAALITRLSAALPEVEIVPANTLDELRDAIGAADILVTSNRVYEAEAARIIREGGKRLRWIQFSTSGIDKALANGIPEGVPVTNAAGSHAHRVAEHAMSLLLAVARRHNEAAAARLSRAWVRDIISPDVISLAKKTLVIVGLGAIGQDVARKAKAFDMRVIGISRTTTPLPNIDEVRSRADLLRTLSEADAVVLCATYDQSTHHIIDAKAIAALKPCAILVNIARGLLIDEVALAAALQTRKIVGAGLDVMQAEPLPADSALWDLPNAVLTPHIGGAGGDITDAMFEIIVSNFALYEAGQPLRKLVHGPAVARMPV